MRRLTAALGAALIASAASAAGPKLTLPQLQGHWVRKDCLLSLKTTRSPMKSSCAGLSFLFIDEQGWKAGYNFHEMSGVRAIVKIRADYETTNLYRLEALPDGDDATPQLMRVTRQQADKPVEIQWLGAPGAPGVLFVRADDGEFAVQANRLVLAGDYVDEKGQPYRFTDASQAVWPGQTFSYDVGLDFVEGPDCDYVVVRGKTTDKGYPLRYGFRRDGGKLLIYGMIETKDEDRCESKPLHALTPR